MNLSYFLTKYYFKLASDVETQRCEMCMRRKLYKAIVHLCTCVLPYVCAVCVCVFMRILRVCVSGCPCA